MGRLTGKIAVVTGAAQGMGAEFARRIVLEGGRVAVTDVNEQAGRALADQLGDDALFVRLDVSSEDDWREALAAVEARFGPVAVLINNAGIGTEGTIEDTSVEAWDRDMAVNLRGPYLGMKTLAASMRRAGGGSVVNISSTAGLGASPGIAAYTASKWAVRGLTKVAAIELGPDIRVNSVHPGPIRTPLASWMSDDFVADQALPRLGEPGEVANVVLLLASDEGSYITGAEIAVDGGRSLAGPPTK